ncbi:MAG TPA: biotin--[acetyl-CoA-carboxylase] ligase, partial [bacterium]
MKKISLVPGLVLKGLKTHVFGRNLLCLEKTLSTNDVALELAKDGAPEGTVVTTEVQTKGRGRQGRRWVSMEGKTLVFSVILRPRLEVEELSEITLSAAVAVAQTLEDYRLKPKIKWPNDLLLSGKKVCGILTEMGPKKDKMISVILGIGINLGQSAMDFPPELRKIATSFYRSSGRKVDRTRFFQKLLLRLEENYKRVMERGFRKVILEWTKRSVTLGCQVKVTQAERFFFGQA